MKFSTHADKWLAELAASPETKRKYRCQLDATFCRSLARLTLTPLPMRSYPDGSWTMSRVMDDPNSLHLQLDCVCYWILR